MNLADELKKRTIEYYNSRSDVNLENNVQSVLRCCWEMVQRGLYKCVVLCYCLEEEGHRNKIDRNAFFFDTEIALQNTEDVERYFIENGFKVEKKFYNVHIDKEFPITYLFISWS